MNPRDLGRLAFGALAFQKVRTRLTIAAVAVGVAAVLLLTSLGESAWLYVRNQFSGLGSNLLIVIPGKAETTGGVPLVGGTTRQLTLEDAEAIGRQLPRITNFAPISTAVTTAKYGGRSRPVTVLGTTSHMTDVRKLALLGGSNLPDIDPRKPAQVCILGATIREELFGARNPLGEVVRLGDYRYRVIGALAHEGQSVGQDMDEVVLVPVANTMRMVNREGLFRILLQVRSFEDVDAAQEDVRRLLTDRHGKEDFTLVTQQAVMDSLGEILGLLTMAVTAIAGISLAVAGIGVMNVMLIAVAERRREVGLLKAIGAGGGQVLALFLAEAAMLSVAGGGLGVLLGLLGARAVEWMMPKFPMTTPLWAMELSLAVSLGVGLVFGVLPAAKAARVSPVAALRGK